MDDARIMHTHAPHDALQRRSLSEPSKGPYLFLLEATAAAEVVERKRRHCLRCREVVTVVLGGAEIATSRKLWRSSKPRVS